MHCSNGTRAGARSRIFILPSVLELHNDRFRSQLIRDYAGIARQIVVSLHFEDVFFRISGRGEPERHECQVTHPSCIVWWRALQRLPGQLDFRD